MAHSKQAEVLRSMVLEILKENCPEELLQAKDVDCFDTDTVAASLKEVLKRYEECVKLWKKSSPVFVVWKERRIKVIEDLEDLACQLDTHKKNCNIARLVGGVVGASGAIMAITGIGLAPFTFGASTPLIIAGSATAMSGGTANVGSTITERAIISKKAKEYHALVLQHKEETKCLDGWINSASEFVESVNKIVDVNIFKEIIESIGIIIGSSSSEEKENQLVKMSISYLVQHILRTFLPPVAMCTINLLLFISSVPKLFNLMCKVAKLHDSNPVMFEAIVLSAKVVTQIFRAADIGVDTVATVISATRAVGAATAYTVAKTVTHSLLAGFGLALDVTSIVLTSKSIHNGSKSKLAKQIREANKKFQEDLEYVSELSDALSFLDDN